MGKKLAEKVEFEVEEILHKSDVKEHDGSTIGPKFYVPISFPNSIVGKLGEEAVKLGYKAGEKVKYNIRIEIID